MYGTPAMQCWTISSTASELLVAVDWLAWRLLYLREYHLAVAAILFIFFFYFFTYSTWIDYSLCINIKLYRNQIVALPVVVAVLIFINLVTGLSLDFKL